jgi:glutathione S-transferase
MYRLNLAHKAYSSWSLRGWLMLDAFALAYEERLAPLYSPAFEAMRRERAPARTVPILEWREDGTRRRVWDSQAIGETLAERHPEAGLWPADPAARAVARCLVAEMHAGFPALRAACPMNLHRGAAPLRATPPDVSAEAARAATLWAWARERTGGRWLAGPAFTLADAFYAPLVTRMTSYALVTDPARDYVALVQAHPSMRRWMTAARAETDRIAVYDAVGG